MLLNGSTAPLAQGMVKGSYTGLDNGHATIGIGDSTAAAAKTQTDLQAATNKTYIGMDATYPTISSSVVTFQCTAGSAVANYVWNEFTITDGAGGSSGLAWIRFVQALNGGVAKAAGQTWTLQISVTMGRNDAAN